MFGYTVPFISSYRTPAGVAITGAVVTYLLTLGGVSVLALQLAAYRSIAS